MKRIMFIVFLIFNTFLLGQEKLKVGITLLPYYSFVANIVKDKADVYQILPTDADVHTYQPSANEVKKIANLDVLIMG